MRKFGLSDKVIKALKQTFDVQHKNGWFDAYSGTNGSDAYKEGFCSGFNQGYSQAYRDIFNWIRKSNALTVDEILSNLK